MHCIQGCKAANTLMYFNTVHHHTFKWIVCPWCLEYGSSEVCASTVVPGLSAGWIITGLSSKGCFSVEVSICVHWSEQLLLSWHQLSRPRTLIMIYDTYILEKTVIFFMSSVNTCAFLYINVLDIQCTSLKLCWKFHAGFWSMRILVQLGAMQLLPWSMFAENKLLIL